MTSIASPQHTTEIVYRDGEFTMILDGETIGMAANFHDAELTLNEIVAAIEAHEPPPDDAPGTDCPEHGPTTEDDCPECRNCGGAHAIQYCPDIRTLLFAPFRCLSCADPLPLRWPYSTCTACIEVGEWVAPAPALVEGWGVAALAV